MLQKFSNGLLAVSLAGLLSACSGGSEPPTEPATEPATAVWPAPLAAAAPAGASGFAPMPRQEVSSAAVDARMAPTMPAVLQSEQHVTESERQAEQLRLVDYEQAYSLEMNRLAQEQAERAQRAAVMARAGVIQGPGCEGAEGHAAVECERSLDQG